MVEIYILTPDWVDGAFLKVCDEAGYITKTFQDIFDCLQLVLIWVDENCRIVGIERGSEICRCEGEWCEYSLLGCKVENFL